MCVAIIILSLGVCAYNKHDQKVMLTKLMYAKSLLGVSPW